MTCSASSCHAVTPPAAPGAGEGLPETPVPEYRCARSVPERLLAMTLATIRPGRLRERFAGLDAVHYPLTIALPSLDVPTAVTVHDLQHLDHPELFSRAERLWRARTHERAARGADARLRRPHPDGVCRGARPEAR